MSVGIPSPLSGPFPWDTEARDNARNVPTDDDGSPILDAWRAADSDRDVFPPCPFLSDEDARDVARFLDDGGPATRCD